jgi:hypothetical protein
MAAHTSPPTTPDERAARLLAIERRASRDLRRAACLTILGCVVWAALGLFLMGWAFHTGDERLGRVAFLSGVLIGDIGVLGTLLGSHLRAEREGWI